ncbi:MAG: DUF86 domain-containing protein [Cyanobacteria bacterium J06634_6]
MVKRDIRDYLNGILTHTDLAQTFTKGMTFSEFEADDKTKLALTRAVEIVGEAAKNVPQYIREQYLEIEWRDIVGMRNKIAHEYFGINFKIVWDTAHNNLPQLKPAIQSILDELIANKDDSES